MYGSQSMKRGYRTQALAVVGRGLSGEIELYSKGKGRLGTIMTQSEDMKQSNDTGGSASFLLVFLLLFYGSTTTESGTRASRGGHRAVSLGD